MLHQPGLQFYGIKLGFKTLARLKFRSSLRYLVTPVNYWRNLEFKLAIEEGYFQKDDVVLDIGSPKLLALYLSKTVGCKIYATDIENYFIKQYKLFRKLEKINPNKLILKTEDGRDLSFEDQFFDKIFSISVLEHIPEEGDIECARQIGRVLKKGGRVIVTVPFSKKSKIDYQSDNFYWAGSSVKRNDGKVFFQRRYSEQDLYDRLIEPSGLKVKTKKYFGERVLTNSSKELSDFLPVIAGPIQPLLSNLFHTAGVNSWKKLEKPLCALLVLEKDN